MNPLNRLLVALALATSTATASELVYKPVNPNFGGDPLNGNYLLNNAQSQDDHEDPSAQGSSLNQTSALDRFTSSLESRLLSNLLNDLEDGTSSHLETSDFIVDILSEDGTITVLITDKTTYQVSEIEVSGL
ncbi:curli assembly protein CsgF [Marinobacterium lutimaris]|uniref:Curli production assembly/transport component CsgF n=1 Tax=Marinobacterium lutimaris TaxID=568106 RepID=A0A1H6AF26_9GAMM|nr:curli assembly protein CsgF [Marinobacterium lutimaris]SEG47308.1 curli production assembly/transport component CsgF [Marinobacterium lutimaris]